MNSPHESVAVGDLSDPVRRVLRLALDLSGASFGVVMLDDGAILAQAGASVSPDAVAAIARLALGQREVVAWPDLPADHRSSDPALAQVRFMAAIPLLDAQGVLLGALALIHSKKLRLPAGRIGRLSDLAALAGDELVRRRDAKANQNERETLFAEIDHRVKNVLAAVQSMASQSARRAVSLDGFLRTFSGRLKAMASAQELLTATRWRGAYLHDLATATLSNLAPGQIRWDGPSLFLGPRAASALTMALHELAVNAVKHGALSSDAGEVQVRWRATEEGGFVLDWVEAGGPQVTPPARQGFGSMLLEEVTGRELGGKVLIDYRTGGVRVTITASAKALVEAEPDLLLRPRPTAASQASIGTLPKAIAAPSPISEGVRGMRLIIVEDAILLAMELEAGLTEAGAKIVGSAALLDEAMALVDLPIDAAVLDCNLNGSSVEPVAQALTARGVPFLFATGYGENRGAPEGFDAPIIRKPYDVAQIAAALAELTGRA